MRKIDFKTCAKAQHRIQYGRMRTTHGSSSSNRTMFLLTCNSESGLAPMKFKSRSEERQNTQKLAFMLRLLVAAWPGF